MEGRGRLSVAALSVVAPVEVIKRPRPPAELTPEQAVEWQAIVDRLPADWFGRETWGMLAAYCRHVVAARRVAQLVLAHETGETFNVGEYDQLLKMQEREGRAMSSLATRMRISQHATYDKKKRKTPSGGARPWQDEQSGS